MAASLKHGVRDQLTSARRYQRFQRTSFDSLDLSVVDLSGLWFDRCTFVKADLRHATLERSHFKMCDFSYANFRGASLRFAGFAACDLRGADLRDCDLTSATFGPVRTGSQNANTDIRDAHWTDGGSVHASFDQVIGRPA